MRGEMEGMHRGAEGTTPVTGLVQNVVHGETSSELSWKSDGKNNEKRMREGA